MRIGKKALAAAVLLLLSAVTGAVWPQERMTAGDCLARCDAAQKTCETRCAKNPAAVGGDCKGFCGMQVEGCRQACAALGAMGQPAPAKPKKGAAEDKIPAADIGLRPLTVTLDYTKQRHERYVPDPQSGSPTRQGEATAKWTMQAKIALEVPDMDYGRGLNSFGYVMGQLSSPEYLEGPGRRKRLPAAKLVSLTGKTSYVQEGRALLKAPMAAECQERWNGLGSGAVAPAQAGDASGTSFDIAFGGGRGIVDMHSPPFTVETKTTSSCPGAQAAPRRSEERIGTREALYAVMTANSLAGGLPVASDPACTRKIETSGGVYRGTARCERKREGGTRGWSEQVTETEALSYTIEFAKK